MERGERDERVVAMTAAMPGPTGLLPFQERFPDRFFDVGIAEQHEMTAAAGMAMGGLRPVVAVYSTFFTRAFDQANLDVGLHRLPVVTVLDRAGITGDDGPSHHGVLDLALCLSIPGMTVFAPSSAEEVGGDARDRAVARPVRRRSASPKTRRPSGAAARARGCARDCSARATAPSASSRSASSSAPRWRLLTSSPTTVSSATVYDVRVVSPPDPRDGRRRAPRHRVIVTVEDGFRHGGAGEFLADAVATAARETGVALPTVRVLGVPRAFLAQGKPDVLLAELGLDGAGIADSVRRALDGAPEAALAIPFAPHQVGPPPIR